MRLVGVLALLVGLTAPVDAGPSASTSSSATVGSSSTTAKRVRKTRKKPKKPKKIARKPSRSSLRNLTNMPRGYVWPPSKRMLAAEKACTAKLDELGVPHKPAKREGRIVRPLSVRDESGAMTLGGITYSSKFRKPPYTVDCQLALALETFGSELVALGVREVKFGSIYRWTNVRVNGQNKNMLSRHALGIAMDIYSFIDTAGREVVVETDYPVADPLLLAIETAVNASGKFRVLVTPKNDPVSHHDHFHIEVAVDYTAKP
ncbi:MAG: extensin family protein [Kofleriaceae bacterium]